MRIKRILLLLGSYDPALHQGIADYARQHGWFLDLSLLKTLAFPDSFQADGILCLLTDNPALEEFVRRAQLPTVDLSIWRHDIPLPRVTAHNHAIGQLAAEHLTQRGHTQFLFYSSTANRVSDERWAGFIEQLGQNHQTATRYSSSESTTIETALLHTPKPVAVFAYSDLDATVIASICHRADLRIPDDVALIGVDNNHVICETQIVPITSINHDFQRIGYEGARLLDRLIDGEAPPSERIQIPPDGVVTRASTDHLAVTHPLVAEAIQFLKGHLHRQIGLSEVAAALRVRPTKLAYHFQKTLHCSIRTLFTRLRLEHARQLLRSTSLPVEDISAQVGFCNAQHFNRMFKKHFHHPPGRFRKVLRDQAR